MGIYKHAGKWMFDFWKAGIRHRKGGFKTKQEAEIAKGKTMERLKKINTDFISLCEKRLEDLELRRSKKHFKENKALLENLIIIWGNKKEVTRDDIEEYLKQIARKNTQTANKRLRLIKALFGYGARRGLCENPAMGIDMFPVNPKKRYIPPLEDVVKVLEIANEEQRNYLLVLINTMARVSEINRLRWDDVYDDYLILRTRKAKNSNVVERKIPLNESLREVLSKMEHAEYVFINPVTGKPYDYRSKFLRTLCKNAKVTYFSFHCLRHLGASRLADGNIPITDIQQLLGHSRVSTTDIYLRSIKPSLTEAVEKLSPLTLTTKGA
ncbi:MAG: site-specific integrase [Thermodesulfovibrionales bacterium]